jgi:hypothetical protein
MIQSIVRKNEEPKPTAASEASVSTGEITDDGSICQSYHRFGNACDDSRKGQSVDFFNRYALHSNKNGPPKKESRNLLNHFKVSLSHSAFQL